MMYSQFVQGRGLGCGTSTQAGSIADSVLRRSRWTVLGSVLCLVGIASNADAVPLLIASNTNNGPGPILNPQNGHYYEFIASPGICWSDAKSAAESSSFLGAPGRLAAFGSDQESDWVVDNLLPIGNSVWFGLCQQEGSEFEPTLGWGWCVGGMQEPLTYVNWTPGEPNNTGTSNEDEGAINIGDNPVRGTWNDTINCPGGGDIQGYVVEYETESAIPTVSEWGVIVTSLSLLTAGTLIHRRRRCART